MDAKQKLIENLKREIEEKEIEIMAKQYRYAIQKVVADILPPSPLPYISGSAALQYDNIQCIVDTYTPHPIENQ